MEGHGNAPSRMKLETVLRMNPEQEHNSYARNSTLQRKAMIKSIPLIAERVRAYIHGKSLEEYFAVADLGCSSGPNTLLTISGILEAVTGLCSQTGKSPPEVLVFLNDLPGNDFNSVFTSLPSFYEKLKKKNKVNCFVAAMPGSFYDRLFPSGSLHFVHSSYSLHWLSQVPELPEVNKGSIYISSMSPPSVFEAYLKQFQRDFIKFLSSRAEEVVPGGEMVLTFMGRSIPDPTAKESTLDMEWLSRSLVEMGKEGLIEEKDIDSFNMPFYRPYKEEVRDLVEEEGSFTINCLETFEANWDPFYHEDDVFDKFKSGQNVALIIRSVHESLLRYHFGEGLKMDDVFERYARFSGEHLSVEMANNFNIVISMTRKSD